MDPDGRVSWEVVVLHEIYAWIVYVREGDVENRGVIFNLKIGQSITQIIF